VAALNAPLFFTSKSKGPFLKNICNPENIVTVRTSNFFKIFISIGEAPFFGKIEIDHNRTVM
jgi:hypothetical protein